MSALPNKNKKTRRTVSNLETTMKMADGKKCKVVLFNSEVGCKHEEDSSWSGIKCRKCGGWFCA